MKSTGRYYQFVLNNTRKILERIEKKSNQFHQNFQRRHNLSFFKN